jgi:hypothetical protein
MQRLVHSLLAALVAASPALAADFGEDRTNADFRTGPIVSTWSPTGSRIGYILAGLVDRTSDAGAPPWTVLTVGAQINAVNRSGVNQIAFGIATEALAERGSFSMLTGIEASAINREPDNPWRKIGVWATFKNRPDTDYFAPPVDPANMGSQALRIESQPGTGFERGIVFAPTSLHASRTLARPAALDLSELSASDLAGVDIIRFPDGCALRYGGRGLLVRACGP